MLPYSTFLRLASSQMSTVARRIPATSQQAQAAARPTVPRTESGTVNLFSIGVCFYISVMLIGMGLFQYIYGAVPAFSTLGVNIREATLLAQAHETFGPALAAAAALTRAESAGNVCLGIILAYSAYMLPFHQKGVLHVAVAIGSALIAVSYHQILKQGHHWGKLTLVSATVNHLSVLRIVFGVFAIVFWLLAVMSFTALVVRRAEEKRTKQM